MPAPAQVAERPAVDAATFAREIAPAYQPVVLRGQVAHWAAVAAAGRGDRGIAEYLAGFGGGAPLEVLVGAPGIAGRYFYADATLTGFNFRRQHVPLGALLGELLRFAEDDVAEPHALYANAATAPEHLPGWEAANPLALGIAAPARLWIGNATQVATHYDTSTNIACVVAGRRRFTLFPPDLARFPRFAEAQAVAQVAELGPGDAIFIPAIWWHHVRALDRLNVLVNYWWDDAPGAAFVALVHAIGAVRDLPPAQKAAWRARFDQLAFAPDAPRAADHLPEAARGVLGAAGTARDAKLRAFLLAMLQRG